jgi:hypothetical protein
MQEGEDLEQVESATLLGCDVDIVIKDRKQGGVGHFRVTHA